MSCSIFEFGKESILRVISQKDCVGLRFTFCLNNDGEESIIISGLTIEKGKPVILNKEAYKKENLDKPITTFDDEKGVGKSYGQFAIETEINLDELMKDDDAPTTTKFVDGIIGLL